MKSMSDIIGRCISSTTLHGLPRTTGRCSFRRVVWIILCVAVFISLLSWTGVIVSKFFRYQTAMTVKIMDEPVPFPEVTICDAKPYDMFTMDSILLSGKQLELKEKFNENNGTKDDWDFIENTKDKLLFPDVTDAIHRRYWTDKYITVANISNEQRDHLRSKLNTVYSFAETLGKNQWKKLGRKAEHFIAGCSYGGQECDYRDWTHKPDMTHGSCFTFTPKTVSGSMQRFIPGEKYGLIVVLFLPSDTLMQYSDYIYKHLDEHNPFEYDGDGARVIVSSWGRNVLPDLEGFKVPPGYSGSISVTATKIKRNDVPTSHCRKSIDHTNKTIYSSEYCKSANLRNCISKQCDCLNEDTTKVHRKPTTTCEGLPLISQNCSDIIEGIMSVDQFPHQCHQTFESWIARQECVDNVINNESVNRSCKYECPQECEAMEYSTHYGLYQWPSVRSYSQFLTNLLVSDKFTNNFPNTKQHQRYFVDHIGNMNDSIPHITATKYMEMGNFAQVKVFIASDTMTQMEEYLAYEIEDVISDIGGQLGLWMGMSVLTLLEMLELIIDILRWMGVKNMNNKKKRQFHEKTKEENAIKDTEEKESCTPVSPV